MRKTLLVANWKMNKTCQEAAAFAEKFLPEVAGLDGVDLVICPPFTCILSMNGSLSSSQVALGAQNMFWTDRGAYTGEIGPSMLIDVGCRYVILGHSERRQILGETDVNINRKVKAALEAELIPILCVGETLQERDNQLALEVVKEQLTRDLKDISLQGDAIVMAYEPVWAIGTGVNASREDAREMITFIRNHLEKMYDRELAQKVRILYGGSVNEDNIADFLAEDDIDGALVGGASLQAASFAKIAKAGING